MRDYTTDDAPQKIPPGYCQCGCGRKTAIAKVSRFKRGITRGQPNRFIEGHTSKGIPPEKRFWQHVDIRGPDECWPWQKALNVGYGVIGNHGRNILTHRLAYELTCGPIPEGMLVCHSCDNPACCNPAHLWLGTPADNMYDRHAKGNYAKGARHPNSKLTTEQVHEIRRLAAMHSITQTAIGEHFGIDQTTVSDIVRHKSWRHLK